MTSRNGRKEFDVGCTPDEFRRRRKAMGLSIPEFARAMDLSVGQVSMLENGKRPMRKVYCLALAQLELMAHPRRASRRRP